MNDMELGGNIVLSGFNEVKPAELIVLKKIIGSYARKFADRLEGYQSLSLNLKEVHKIEDHSKYELHAKLLHDGKVTTSEVIDRNIFIALDSVLKKIESEVLRS